MWLVVILITFQVSVCKLVLQNTKLATEDEYKSAQKYTLGWKSGRQWHKLRCFHPSTCVQVLKDYYFCYFEWMFG